MHNGEQGSEAREALVRKVILFLTAIALVVVGSYFLAVALIPTPKVGIIEMQASINGFLAERMASEIDFAINARDIKAVVLVVDSPGGGAAAGNDVYFQVRRLREHKPVVVSIDSLAASGAYQVSVAANEIYAKPASIVGNVGVVFRQPSPETLDEQLITTGPFKNTGSSATSFLQILQLIFVDFRDTVVTERLAAPNPLKMAPEDMATGAVWVGLQAKELGLIDELGSRLDAIDAAARLANLQKFEVIDVRDAYLASLEGSRLQTALDFYAMIDTQAEFDLSSQRNAWPAIYELYIPLE
jgi:protease IV